MKIEEDGIKKLANEFKSSQVLAEQLSSTRDLAEQFKKATTIKVPDYSNLLPKYNFFKIAQAFNPIYLRLDGISTLTKNMEKTFAPMREALQLGVTNQLSQAVQGIMMNIPKINSVFSSEEFKRFVEGLSRKQKSKFVDYLAFDWYIPLDILEEFPIVPASETQVETDRFVLSVFSELKQEHGVEVLDFVPKSLRSYKDKNTLEILLRENLYKQAVMFCMERIERVIVHSQPVEKYKDIKINSKGLVEFKKNTKEEKSTDGYIAEVFEKLEVAEDSIRMFKPFSNFLEKKYEVLPLNRNLFFHGWVAEEDVDEGIVLKAILAWAFFERLSVEKQKRNTKVPIGISRIKKIPKTRTKEKPQSN